MEVGKVFADAARRGVDVRGLVWCSQWDRLASQGRQAPDSTGSTALLLGSAVAGFHDLAQLPRDRPRPVHGLARS